VPTAPAKENDYYELTSKTLVEVERIRERIAYLADGSQAWLADLTRPVWLIEGGTLSEMLLDSHNRLAT